ncbi:hypothetical protein [Absidia glauca]|uniref:Uncharacterized protein n=1 Tax=Absidia glauca TaxID=4829 RepID=A0A163JKR4_ABSGL|nr:hypothetical protein [Absidia glauca]
MEYLLLQMAAYREVYPKKKKVPTLAVDLTMLFDEAKACTTIMGEGNRVLVESVKAAASRQISSMKEEHAAGSSGVELVNSAQQFSKGQPALQFGKEMDVLRVYCMIPRNMHLDVEWVHPENGRVLHWLNRSVQDTETIRPDGAMYLKKQRHTKYACGFVEVKSGDNEDDISIHNDLFRLGKFCKDTLDSGYMKALVAVQVVDCTMIFYLFTLEAAGLYVLFELGRVDAPMTYNELPRFAMELDLLKQISAAYRTYCVETGTAETSSGWKRPSLAESDLKEVLNPGSLRSKKSKSALYFH